VKGVILAAGTASRLRPLTDALPKCLLPLGNGTLLGRTLDNLEAVGLSDIVIVTGYLEDKIKDHVRERHPRIRPTFITNSVYASTNNIYSLWLAREEIVRAGMLLLDSDILFDSRILETLLRSGHPDVLALKTGFPLGDEEIKVQADADMRIRKIGKDVPPSLAAGESIGIELFSPALLDALFKSIGRRVAAGDVNTFYESAFQDVIDDGAAIRAVDIGDRLAIEIDTIDDFRSAERDIVPLLPRS